MTESKVWRVWRKHSFSRRNFEKCDMRIKQKWITCQDLKFHLEHREIKMWWFKSHLFPCWGCKRVPLDQLARDKCYSGPRQGHGRLTWQTLCIEDCTMWITSSFEQRCVQKDFVLKKGFKILFLNFVLKFLAGYCSQGTISQLFQ